MLTGNQPIKRCIEQATRYYPVFRVELILWHGDGTGKDTIYNEVLVIDNANEKTLMSKYYGFERPEKDLDKLLGEQQRLFNFLCKHFESVTKREQNV